MKTKLSIAAVALFAVSNLESATACLGHNDRYLGMTPEQRRAAIAYENAQTKKDEFKLALMQKQQEELQALDFKYPQKGPEYQAQKQSVVKKYNDESANTVHKWW